MNGRYGVLADIVCLIYHEARNIRWPIRAGKLVPSPQFEKLLQLPDNSREAWRQMRRAREVASNAQSAVAVAGIFEAQYGIRLEDVYRMFEQPIWKHSARGGNVWARIAQKLLSLLEEWAHSEPSSLQPHAEILLQMMG